MTPPPAPPRTNTLVLATIGTVTSTIPSLPA